MEQSHPSVQNFEHLTATEEEGFIEAVADNAYSPEESAQEHFRYLLLDLSRKIQVLQGTLEPVEAGGVNEVAHNIIEVVNELDTLMPRRDGRSWLDHVYAFMYQSR